MPSYEFRCNQCDATESVLLPFSEAPPVGSVARKHCSECGSCLVRIVSAPPIHFRGRGWAKYEDGTPPGTLTHTGGKI